MNHRLKRTLRPFTQSIKFFRGELAFEWIDVFLVIVVVDIGLSSSGGQRSNQLGVLLVSSRLESRGKHCSFGFETGLATERDDLCAFHRAGRVVEQLDVCLREHSKGGHFYVCIYLSCSCLRVFGGEGEEGEEKEPFNGSGWTATSHESGRDGQYVNKQR